MTRILVIDDDQAVLNYLNVFLLQTGEYEVSLLSDSSRAAALLESSNFDVVLLDMDMPEVTGLDILKTINEKGIEVETIVLTGVEDIELAVAAMKQGAFDYLTKPVYNDNLLRVIGAAVEASRTGKNAAAPPSADGGALAFPEAFTEIQTCSEQIHRIFQTIEKLAPTENSLLIWGESGTGKELVARAVHRLSRRRDKCFVAVNAGAFADELFASEFFGHQKGSFTGAHADKRGFLEEADKGTLFLDEIGELSLPIQVKLLRVLQEGEFFRIGSTRNMRVDIRVIAATNKNLFEEMKKGNFRKDLFYRLNMNSIYIPPLKERKCDIPLLASHFLKKYSEQNGKKIERISETAMKLLLGYDYPGNIRELMNIINSGVIIENSNELRKKSLPQYFLETAGVEENGASALPQKSLKEVEKEHIARVLRFTGGNKTHAARILGISRVSLISKVKQYGLEC